MVSNPTMATKRIEEQGRYAITLECANDLTDRSKDMQCNVNTFAVVRGWSRSLNPSMVGRFGSCQRARA